MENHHKKTSSDDIFSFFSSPSHDQESDFEFGCFTPDSPSIDPFKNSPADRIFLNGRLLPHSFPLQQQQTPSSTVALAYNISRPTSRASSIGSKDSLMSSRSNSTNSSRSSVSSARTSSSGVNSDGRLLYHHSSKIPGKTPVASKTVMAQLYGSSQRWQHIVPVPVPVPVLAALKREDSRHKTSGAPAKEALKSKKKKREERKKERSSGLFRRIFRSLLLACRECHAMEPSTKNDHQLAENMEL